MLLFFKRFILFFTASVFCSTAQSVIPIPPEKPTPYQTKEEIFSILSLPKNALIKNASTKKKEQGHFLPLILIKPYRPTIVLDAGHGGKDPGSISYTGYYEKDIVLKTTLYLYKELRKTLRYKVVLTRRKDIFVPIRERFDVARKAQADFFISIHGDSHPSPKVRGLTIYTLSEQASDKEALRLSKKENKADYFEGISLASVSKKENSHLFDIFVDIAQRGSSNAALVLAKNFHEKLNKNKPGKIMALRSAGLTVLKAPEVPSILVELGYLSNAKDEKLIQTLKYKKAIAHSLIQALDAYFKKS